MREKRVKGNERRVKKRESKELCRESRGEIKKEKK